MKIIYLLLIAFFVISFAACGQTTTQKTKTIKKNNMMGKIFTETSKRDNGERSRYFLNFIKTQKENLTG